MKIELVLLEPNMLTAEPFTTSKIVADRTGVGHRHIKKQIAQNEQALLQFGLLVAHETESTGGRPEEIIRLNEQQATLLVTFLKNTPEVVKFKTELVRQFFRMREELKRRQIVREVSKPNHRELMDAIKDSGTDDKWAYKKYNDLAYIITVGKNSRSIRSERGAPKNAIALDYMSADEMQEIDRVKRQMAVLIDLGMDYQQIKEVLSSAHCKQVSA